MPSPLSPRRGWPVLWLWMALALLPLRGWAQVTMPLTMAAGDVPAVMVMEQGPAATTPCHGDSADESADDSAGEAHACMLCGVCHSTVADAPRAPLLLAAQPSQKPQADAPADVEPAVFAGPERPPRSFLA